MKILNQVKKTISNWALVNKNQTILVGVSGGVDSVVLAHSLHALGYRISIAHANFKLRGQESDADEVFVKEFSKELDVPFFSKELSFEGSGRQEIARRNRYDWFTELSEENAFDHIALGHNANDNFETALFHLIKGEGILNQRGIPIKTDRIIRPLLFCTRDEILEYAKENNLEWREDSSNRENKYHRNLIRNKIIPLIREINPSIEKSYQRDHKREMEIRDLIIPMLQLSRNWLNDSEKEVSIDLASLKENPAWFLALEFFLKSHGYRSEQQEELGKFLESDSGSQFILESSTLIMDRGKLILSFEKSAAEEHIVHEMDLPFEIKSSSKKIRLDQVEKDGIEFTTEKTDFLDLSKLNWPLRIRSWKEGDSFQPLGMTGRKKLSDLLIDKKIPVSQKAGMMVIESDGEIALVIGIQPSEKFKIDKDSNSALRVRTE